MGLGRGLGYRLRVLRTAYRPLLQCGNRQRYNAAERTETRLAGEKPLEFPSHASVSVAAYRSSVPENIDLRQCTHQCCKQDQILKIKITGSKQALGGFNF